MVATPIGHLGDLSPRLREALESSSLVLAEDTRRTRALLAHLGISRPLLSLHAHNEARRLGALLERLARGESLALVSDAGTPLVCDPGAVLVAAVHRLGARVSPVPGPSAVTAALSVSGFPADRFRFEGFLPASRGPRRRRLADLARDPSTLVFYEAPHRLAGCLEDARDAFGGSREAVLAHELTKVHETVVRASLEEHLRRLAEAGESGEGPRGEYVVVVGPRPPVAPSREISPEERRLLGILAEELPPGRAAALAARLWGIDRREAYAALGTPRVPEQGDGGGP